jgi:uncharacterized membrane protein
VRDAAVVVREEDGKIVEKDDYGHDSTVGATSGGLAGLLVGVLGGPLGVLIGGATGLLVGSLFDDDEDEDTESVLGQISKSIKVGFPALLADVSEDSTVAIDAVMDPGWDCRAAIGCRRRACSLRPGRAAPGQQKACSAARGARAQ